MHFYHVLNSPEFVITSVLNVTVDGNNIRDVLNGLNLGLSNQKERVLKKQKRSLSAQNTVLTYSRIFWMYQSLCDDPKNLPPPHQF